MIDIYTGWKRSILMVLAFSPVTTIAGIEHLLYEVETPSCILSAKHDAVEGQPGVLIIQTRARQSDRCKIDIQKVSTFIDRALQALEQQPELAPISSIYLGRLVNYPWLSYELKSYAMTPGLWDIDHGKGVNSHENAFVNQYLINSPRLNDLKQITQQYGLTITDASCEKVLLNQDRLPYDAMCWLVVKRNQAPKNNNSMTKSVE